jgi:hypothetical protein
VKKTFSALVHYFLECLLWMRRSAQPAEVDRREKNRGEEKIQKKVLDVGPGGRYSHTNW